MTALKSFESLFSIFFGTEYPDFVTYLASVAVVLVIAGLIALLVGMFNKRAGKYIGIAAVIAVVMLSLMVFTKFKVNIVMPEGVNITWLFF